MLQVLKIPSRKWGLLGGIEHIQLTLFLKASHNYYVNTDKQHKSRKQGMPFAFPS